MIEKEKAGIEDKLSDRPSDRSCNTTELPMVLVTGSWVQGQLKDVLHSI